MDGMTFKCKKLPSERCVAWRLVWPQLQLLLLNHLLLSSYWGGRVLISLAGGSASGVSWHLICNFLQPLSDEWAFSHDSWMVLNSLWNSTWRINWAVLWLRPNILWQFHLYRSALLRKAQQVAWIAFGCYWRTTDMLGLYHGQQMKLLGNCPRARHHLALWSLHRLALFLLHCLPLSPLNTSQKNIVT